jgi:hypothetical protein
MRAFIMTSLLVCLFGGLSSSAFAAEKEGKKVKKESSEKKEKTDKSAASGEVQDESDPEISDILDSMGYPELQVVPRASERLKIEAKQEASTWYVEHWPVELSGLATLAVGMMATKKDDLNSKQKDDADTVSMLTKGVGLGWIVGGVLLGAQKPYGHGKKAVDKVTGKDERAALLRERLSEEALERPAKTMRILRHVAVVTNFTMNVATMAYADDKSLVTAGVAAVLAFLPYMFEDPSIAVYDKHIEYKKKIYTPLKGASVYIDPETHKLTPMSTLVWNF